jgi:hypothetical protein
MCIKLVVKTLQREAPGLSLAGLFIHRHCEKPWHERVIMWEKRPLHTGKTNFVILMETIRGVKVA